MRTSVCVRFFAKACRRLDERHVELSAKTLKKISRRRPLSEYVPQTRVHVHDYQMRNASNYTVFKCRTERLQCTAKCFSKYDLNV